LYFRVRTVPGAGKRLSAGGRGGPGRRRVGAGGPGRGGAQVGVVGQLSGATSDLEHASKIARAMVKEFV
jgi:hypothetical protein